MISQRSTGGRDDRVARRPMPSASQALDLAATRAWARLLPSWLRALLWADSANRYDAFLSYSWKCDSAVAPVIQSLMHGFLRPWYRLRALTVFRDLSCLPAGSSLEAELFDRLDRSDHLIVLASPDAAQSAGMEQEAVHWFSRPRAGHVLVIVTAGSVHTWDQIREQLLPPSLRSNLAVEPLFVLLQHRREQILKESSDAREQLIEDLKQIFLRLYPGRDWGQLRGEERRNRRNALALIAGVLVALSALTGWALYQRARANHEAQRAKENAELASKNEQLARNNADLANKNAEEARSQAEIARARERVARSRALAIQAREARALPETAMLLGLAAMQTERTADTESALLGAMLAYPRLEGSVYAWHSEANRTIQAVAASPRGKGIVAGFQDGALIAWRGDRHTAGTYLRRPLGGSASGVTALAFNIDETRLTAAFSDGSVQSWNWSDLRPLPRIALTEGGTKESAIYQRAGALAFEPRTGTLAIGQADGRIRLWDTVKGQPIGLAFGDPIPPAENAHILGVQGLAYSRDGSFLLSTHGGRIGEKDGSIRIWDTRGGYRTSRVVRTQTEGVPAMAVHPEGQWFAYGFSDGAVRLEEVSASEPRVISASPAIEGPRPDGVRSLAFSPSGDLLAAASSSGQVILWRGVLSVDGPELLDLFSAGESAHLAAVAFEPGSERLVTGGADGVVRLWHTKPTPAGVSFGKSRLIGGAAFSGDGSVLVTADHGGTLQWWDVARRSPIHARVFEDNVQGAAVRFVSPRVVEILTQRGGLLRCSPTSCQSVILKGTRPPAGTRSFGPDAHSWFEWGERPYRCTLGGCVALSGPGAGAAERNVNAANADGSRWTVGHWEAGASPRGVVSFCRETGCRSLDLGPGGPSSWVGATTFSRDGSILAVGLGDGRVLFFDGYSGERLGPAVQAHSGGVTHFAFSSDGSRFVSGGRGGTVQLWDLGTRRPMGTVFPRPGLQQVTTLQFFPNDRNVLVQYSNGEIVELDIDVGGYWQNRACTASGRDLSTFEWLRYGLDGPLEPVCGAAPRPAPAWIFRPPRPF